MRFMFYTDSQLSGNTPRHRIDDYPKAVIAKMAEAYEIAEQRNCEFVAFGGDFFNSHRIFSYGVVGDVMDVICDSDLKTYACIGEHDLYGHSPNTYPSSTLAFVARRCSNLVTLHDPITLGMGDVVIHAKHEWELMDEAMKRKPDPSKLNILLCHELLTNGSAPFEVINTSTLTGCPFDIVCSGDLHGGFDPHKVDKTWFLNPGSLARQTTADADRMPQVAIVDIEKGKEPSIEYVRLKCAKPGRDVFGQSVLEMVKSEHEFDGEVFAEEMLGLEAESVDVYELIQKAGKKKGLSNEVLAYLASKKGREAGGVK